MVSYYHREAFWSWPVLYINGDNRRLRRHNEPGNTLRTRGDNNHQLRAIQRVTNFRTAKDLLRRLGHQRDDTLYHQWGSRYLQQVRPDG